MATPSTPLLPKAGDIALAAERLAGHAIATPVLANRVLDERSQRRVWCKAENLQHTGSFKFRGAYHRLSCLTPEERSRGVVAWSSGNHAQGVALAASVLGIPASIVMPSDAPAIKTANTLALGAHVIPYDRFSEDREAIAYDLARREGYIVVPSYDDPHIIAGQGTAGFELMQAVPDLDALLVCCSGGGLVAGCALAAEYLKRDLAIYTVEPEEFDDHRRSFLSGSRERNTGDARSFCDALLAPTPGELTFAINQPRLAGGLVVTDDEVAEAIRFGFEHLKVVLEPGGAVALAAVLSGKVPEDKRRVGVMLSGGNIDSALFAELIATVSS
jgi:threonine dehydratase